MRLRVKIRSALRWLWWKKSKIAIYGTALLIGILWVLPFMGVFMASVRPYGEIVEGWWRFEEFQPTLANFGKAWNHPRAPISTGLFNSLVITCSATLLTIIPASLAGYAFSRFKIPLKGMLFFAIILVMAMPAQSIIIPLYSYMGEIGFLADPIRNRIGLILVHTAWGLPWSILFLRNFFLSVPLDLEESARVDGASDLTIFRRIIFPIARPAIISVAVLQFIWVWNDFFFALILLQPFPEIYPFYETRVVTQMIPALKGRYYIDWSLLSAASVMAMAIPILIFIFLQKFYVRGVMAGAIKG